ncbi:hypothetical protein HWB76_gp109 [Streptomyces phage Blueeyedbeauty]|uniref:Uncharacterized protein n=1 Tax=Streptomyces phage Blueeyedbeauty TaxID=2250336 RepID=A0A345L1Z1_9CAUD|nr:hypothetical protein HWB76_gp109 [Streptomyces phage Blueeyedbeauty]AXH49293.1 hypothetical protein SEA_BLUEEYEDBEAUTY_182 [Streptomyces phage Blueeyedbeauty]
MIQLNSRVKINDTYSGGIPDVIGKVGKVEHVAGTVYQLSVSGKRESSYYKGHFYDYKVIATASEIDEVPYDFKDMEGTTVELGDIVVYGSNTGNLTKGKVVDFKDMTYPRWEQPRQELKFQLEYEVDDYLYDGGDRRLTRTETRRMWLSKSSRTLVVQKGLSSYFPGELIIQDV